MSAKKYLFVIFMFSAFIAVTAPVLTVQAKSFCNGVSGRKSSQGCGNNEILPGGTSSALPKGFTPGQFKAEPQDCNRFKKVSVYGVFPSKKQVKALIEACEAEKAASDYSDYWG